MSVLSMVAGALRLERKPVAVAVVEREPVMWEADGSEEWTVDGTVQLMIANGADEREIAEFVRRCSG